MSKTSLYNDTAYQGIVNRLHHLTPQSQRLWGTMGVAQMLAHVRKAMETSFPSDKPAKFSLIGFLLGPLIKRMVLNDKPYKQNLPTGKQVIVKDNRDFDQEMSKLLHTIDRFRSNGPAAAAAQAHPMFGKMSEAEWGFSQWKHLDHHLKQFGA